MLSGRRVFWHACAFALGGAFALGQARQEASSEGKAPSHESATLSRGGLPAPGFAPDTADATPAPTAEAPAVVDPLGRAYGDGLIITGGTPHRLILFSFDDGPDVRTTPLLLDRLEEADVRAVFFLVASRLTEATPRERQQSSIAREIAARGHLVGGHTVSHVQLPLLDDLAVALELDTQDRSFERLFGARPSLFRPPYGAHSERIDQLLAARGYTTVLWNLGSGDFQVRTADDVFALWLRVLERREQENGERGGIVLLHDTYAWSVDAFERIHRHLMARNCELLERGEELYDIVDDVAFFYAPRNGALPSTEAAPAQLAPAVLESRQAALRRRTALRCRSLASTF